LLLEFGKIALHAVEKALHPLCVGVHGVHLVVMPAALSLE
jgi:hypothetical protein